MATITASTVSSTVSPAITGATVARKLATSSSVIGLPQFQMRGGKVRCSSSSEKVTPKQGSGVAGASLLAAASVMSMSSPVLALVDERLSTEGTGLSLGLSNNLLGWILLGVFGLIWALFFVYTSTLEEDEESGLSL